MYGSLGKRAVGTQRRRQRDGYVTLKVCDEARCQLEEDTKALKGGALLRRWKHVPEATSLETTKAPLGGVLPEGKEDIETTGGDFRTLKWKNVGVEVMELTAKGRNLYLNPTHAVAPPQSKQAVTAASSSPLPCSSGDATPQA